MVYIFHLHMLAKSSMKDLARRQDDPTCNIVHLVGHLIRLDEKMHLPVCQYARAIGQQEDERECENREKCTLE